MPFSAALFRGFLKANKKGEVLPQAAGKPLFRLTGRHFSKLLFAGNIYMAVYGCALCVQ